MKIYVYLLCFNERTILADTVKHYRRYLPGCKITIYDNESTDGSPELAESLGCEVVSFGSEKIMNEFILVEKRNACWKEVVDGWVVMADMDEWLCVTLESLEREEKKGTTVLLSKGYNMIGNSQSPTLDDIDLQSITSGAFFENESKCLCFKRPEVVEMNYEYGSHKCVPSGKIRFSDSQYINKHMTFPGLPFLMEKYKQRYIRAKFVAEKYGLNVHYTDKIEEIEKLYNEAIEESEDLTDYL